MPKGPKFLASNSERHAQRTKAWNEECAAVDVEALRVQLSIEYVRHSGGLSYEDRQALRARISEIQIPKERRERYIEARRETWMRRAS